MKQLYSKSKLEKKYGFKFVDFGTTVETEPVELKAKGVRYLEMIAVFEKVDEDLLSYSCSRGVNYTVSDSRWDNIKGGIILGFEEKYFSNESVMVDFFGDGAYCHNIPGTRHHYPSIKESCVKPLFNPAELKLIGEYTGDIEQKVYYYKERNLLLYREPLTDNPKIETLKRNRNDFYFDKDKKAYTVFAYLNTQDVELVTYNSYNDFLAIRFSCDSDYWGGYDTIQDFKLRYPDKAEDELKCVNDGSAIVRISDESVTLTIYDEVMLGQKPKTFPIGSWAVQDGKLVRIVDSFESERFYHVLPFGSYYENSRVHDNDLEYADAPESVDCSKIVKYTVSIGHGMQGYGYPLEKANGYVRVKVLSKFLTPQEHALHAATLNPHGYRSHSHYGPLKNPQQRDIFFDGEDDFVYVREGDLVWLDEKESNAVLKFIKRPVGDADKTFWHMLTYKNDPFLFHADFIIHNLYKHSSKLEWQEITGSIVELYEEKSDNGWGLYNSSDKNIGGYIEGFLLSLERKAKLKKLKNVL